MCKTCDANCIYFPDIDKQFEYIIDKKSVKHKVDSKKYKCIFLNKNIKNGKKCKKYTTNEEIKQYRKELIHI